MAPVSYVSKNFEIKRYLHPMEFLEIKYKRNAYLIKMEEENKEINKERGK